MENKIYKQLKLPLFPEFEDGGKIDLYGEQLKLDLFLDYEEPNPYGTQLSFPYLIEVIKVVNDDIRACKIYSAIISRMATNNKSKNLVFIEKNTELDKDFIKENNILNYPTTMIFKNGILKKSCVGILSSSTLIQIIKEIQYL